MTDMADRAWQQFCATGVIMPDYADEIAARQRLQREWSDVGRGLR